MSKVIIAGSINMDMVATVERPPQQGETVKGGNLHFIPGGKGANQAVAAAKLGAEVELFGAVGDDDFGKTLKNFIKSSGVNINSVREIKDTKSGAAIVVLTYNDNFIITISGANAKLKPGDLNSLIINKEDILLSQFEIPLETIKEFFKRGKKAGTTNILNPSPERYISDELYMLSDILIINEIELASNLKIGKIKNLSFDSVIKYAKKLRKFPEQIIIVTLGKLGAIAVSQDQEFKIPGKKVKVVDTTGAGDCFAGALATSLSKNHDLEYSLNFANLAASLKVQKLGAGTGMPTFKETTQQLSSATQGRS